VKSFSENGYKVNDIFSMKLSDIVLLTEMLETDLETESELTEDFLDLLM
jgi:hypothetical protein